MDGTVLGLLGFLGRDENPPERDDKPEAGSYAEGARRADLVKDCTAREAAQEEEEYGHDLVVARGDKTAEVEQLGIGHEFAPRRGEDD